MPIISSTFLTQKSRDGRLAIGRYAAARHTIFASDKPVNGNTKVASNLSNT